MDFGLSSSFSVGFASFVASLPSAATLGSTASTESACVGCGGLDGSGVFDRCCGGSGERLFSAGFSFNASFLLLFATLDGGPAAFEADVFTFLDDAEDDELLDDDDDDELDELESLSLSESLLDELDSRLFPLIFP